MLKQYLRPCGSLVLVMTLILGFIYPAIVTGLGAVLFRAKAEGSLLFSGTTLIGSRLVGQSFADPGHFWGRPSATSPQAYNGLASGGSNLGPLNPALLDAVKANAEKLHHADPNNTLPIPVELLTASASGLDPHISPAAAEYQSARVARVRGLPPATVRALVQQHETAPLLGILGAPTINVLELNLALDRLSR